MLRCLGDGSVRKRGTDYLRKLNLPGVDGEILRENLQLLEVFNTLIKEAEREIELLLRRTLGQASQDCSRPWPHLGSSGRSGN